MRVKRKEWNKLQKQLAGYRDMANMRIRLVAPSLDNNPPIPIPGIELLNVRIRELFFIQKYGGYGYYMGHKYGVDLTSGIAPTEWIYGPVKFMVEVE